MKEKLVSVIIPVYNAEEYIGKCLESVRNQTYKNLEILIINDGSKDNSENIIIEYQKKDDRIKYYYKSNSGCGETRNFGLDRANGEFIYFIDSDDYIDKTMIEKLVNSIKDEDSFVGLLQFYYDLGTKLKIVSMSEDEQRTLKSPSVCTRLFRNDVIKKSKIRFSGAKIGEDLEFVTKLLIFNNHSSYINERPLYYYRLHENSITHSKNPAERLSIIKVLENIKSYANEQGKYNIFEDLICFITTSHIYFAVLNLSQIEDTELLIKEILEYLTVNYPNWENNKLINNFFLEQKTKLLEFINLN